MPAAVSEHCAVTLKGVNIVTLSMKLMVSYLPKTLEGRRGKEVIITGGKGREKRVMKLDVKTQKW